MLFKVYKLLIDNKIVPNSSTTLKSDTETDWNLRISWYGHYNMELKHFLNDQQYTTTV